MRMQTFYIETYGCRMNICDSEVIIAILTRAGMKYVTQLLDADVVILNSCSVREDGHNKIYERLDVIAEDRNLSKKCIVITGCFASLLSKSLFLKYDFVDLVAHPKTYRELPSLLGRISDGEFHLLAPLKNENEIYEDVLPIRQIEDTTTAAVVVMKGCNQYCSYCIEPITRGEECSRSVKSILRECEKISSLGYKEITLVGHIIDKYHWIDTENYEEYDFPKLLALVAEKCPQLRIKFLSSHPSFFDIRTVCVMQSHANIMRVIHLPVQSASDDVLIRMNRGYSYVQFVELVNKIRNLMPDISIITDIMVGFCGETYEDFCKTLQMVRKIEFDDINVFRFSMRSRTKASKVYIDDIDQKEKQQRSQIICYWKNQIKERKYRKLIGQKLYVIVETENQSNHYCGRDIYHRVVYFFSLAKLHINDLVLVSVNNVSNCKIEGTCLKVVRH